MIYSGGIEAWGVGAVSYLGMGALLHFAMALSKAKLRPLSFCPFIDIKRSPGSTTVWKHPPKYRREAVGESYELESGGLTRNSNGNARLWVSSVYLPDKLFNTAIMQAVLKSKV